MLHLIHMHAALHLLMWDQAFTQVHVHLRLQGFLNLPKSSSHLSAMLLLLISLNVETVQAVVKSLLILDFNSQSEAYSSKWLECGEPLRVFFT